jgi:hypothetical protein
MILIGISALGIALALLASRLIAGVKTAAVTTGALALVLPYLALLYAGHPVAGVTLRDLLLIAACSALLVVVLKHRQAP